MTRNRKIYLYSIVLANNSEQCVKIVIFTKHYNWLTSGSFPRLMDPYTRFGSVGSELVLRRRCLIVECLDRSGREVTITLETRDNTQVSIRSSLFIKLITLATTPEMTTGLGLACASSCCSSPSSSSVSFLGSVAGFSECVVLCCVIRIPPALTAINIWFDSLIHLFNRLLTDLPAGDLL